MLRITEEILRLILDTEQGNIRVSLPEHTRDIVIAGAVLMDLAMEDRIDTDFQQLILVSPMPLGDDFLDPTLADIANTTDTHTTLHIGSPARRSGVSKSAKGRSSDWPPAASWKLRAMVLSFSRAWLPAFVATRP